VREVIESAVKGLELELNSAETRAVRRYDPNNAGAFHPAQPLLVAANVQASRVLL
jgi:hypothetical protein